MWYAISYTHYSDTLSDKEIGKIASSFKSPSEIKNVDYTLPDLSLDPDTYNGLTVYDKDDLKKCVDALEFTPKLPIKINKDIKLKECYMTRYHDYDLDGSAPYRVLNCIYSYGDGDYISFTQEKDKDTINYEKTKEDGYAMNFNNVKEKTSTETIGNVDVIKYFDTSTKRSVYLWKENGTYYYLSYYYGKTPTWIDDIAEQFIKSEPVNL